MTLFIGTLFGEQAMSIWSSYAIALGALLLLWIISVRWRRNLNKTLALFDSTREKKPRKK